MKLRIVLLLAAAVSTWAAEHNRLLPQPQRVIYGSGRLPVEGLPIRFAAPPATEDQFAANQISQGLASVLGHPAVAAGTTPALQLIREGDGAALPQNDETTGSASRESYTLRVTPEGAEIRARSSAGLFYGAQTLLQLIEGAGTSAFVPSVEIEDWPSLAYRGVMFDMSHGPLPTVEEIKRQLDFMARFKANQYYFYTELSVELKGYSLLNPDARYTQDEVRQIVSYAR